MLSRFGLRWKEVRCRAVFAVSVALMSAGAHADTWLAPVSTIAGPQIARGVVVYSHGRSLTGWDVLRFNRPADEDTLPASSQDLTARAKALKAQGYRRVILTGQSFGAFLSIM